MIKHLVRKNKLFLLCVVFPTVLATIYFGLVASDVYISESRFVVRSPDRQSTTGLGALLKGAGFTKSQDDSYTVHDYVLSRDALKGLNSTINFRTIYTADTIDVFSRFGGLGGSTSFESMFKYYLKRIELQQDSASSISTITVNAYTSQEAFQINERLLELSESLVNRLNERGRLDLIRFAAMEVTDSEEKSRKAASALSGYRNAKNVMDPERQATFQFQQIAKLQDELIAAKTQLIQLKAFTPENPQIGSLKLRVNSLQTEIDLELSRTAGGQTSLANKSVDFQRLSLERDFAEKQLAGALNSLQLAKNEALRQQVYLERIVQPSIPDSPAEPRRVRGVFGTFILGLIAWGILLILVGGIREHQD